ncbi:MAG TPA: glycosyltransferase family 1 protein [Candidatus Binatia bacterium]|nr:glycosyltransferase family 1 protein [Candidatus Binatia bacterium]
MEILYDARWIGNHGIGRFAGEMQRAIPGMSPYRISRRPSHPCDPVLLGAALWRLQPRLFFSPGYNSPAGWPGPFVFTLHDLHHLHVPDNSSAMKRAYYRYFIRPACHRAQAVLTVSDYSRDEIARWAGIHEQRIVNVGNGVGPAFSEVGPRFSPGFPYLLYVGSRKPHKNLTRLLRAFAAAGVDNEIRLLLSGSPDGEIASLVHDCRLAGRVAFAELPDDDSLAAAYRGAVAVVFPSLYEGFGLPPLEAMACATPVITSNVCAIPEVVGDAAWLVDPLRVDDIAHAIRSLVEDKVLQQTLRERGVARAARFSWKTTAGKVSAVLTSVSGRTVLRPLEIATPKHQAISSTPDS